MTRFGLLAFIFVLGCSNAQSTTSTGSTGGATSSTTAATTSGATTSVATGASTTSAVSASSTSGTGGAPTCGVRSGKRGLTSRNQMVQGANRTYLIYLPPTLDPTKPVPFVFVAHGYTMSGQAMHDITGYTALADTEGFGVAFPDGESGPNSLGPPWNVGQNVCPSTLGTPPLATGDDLAFLDAMAADVTQDQCLDKAHVFVTGFSMGGYFSHEVGCMRPDIRAVAPHSGGTHDLSTCITGHKPIIIFHGTTDNVIDDGCDDPMASNIPSGVTPSATAWAMKNGCSLQTTATAVQGGTCRYYVGCPADGQVAICTFDNMAHCWAGGANNAGIFSCPNYESATKLEWEFWKKYAW